MFVNTPHHQFVRTFYTIPHHVLQSITIWLPRPLDYSPIKSTIWIIYVHGGAWRDPECDSDQFIPTVNYLSHASNQDTMSGIAGFASINYRLSPYPDHTRNGSDPQDAYRNVQHPAHLQDVVQALEYLSKHFLIDAYGWIGVGHSAGATLLTQLLSDVDIAALPKNIQRAYLGLHSLILIAGIYDLPRFVRNHSGADSSKTIKDIYMAIVTGAFGQDPLLWVAPSPIHRNFGMENWPSLRFIVMARSDQDQLVEEEQNNVMDVALRAQGWVGERESDTIPERQIWRRSLSGAHDDVWKTDGGQIAMLIEEVLDRLLENVDRGEVYGEEVGV
ncbi:uncharacterized protein BDZ99DRAFT_460588 [Mytilinidion resinicola]|uniref:BD-FAE-like domain-containing protein n=1 Tax=Mytilinidion resinicola TaxID=574789 RepID=A0A6A6YY25_9PEZI|nr:uncharacterized protein BDZ99DRAFT_460588 [Mytilinidion resinicola]KAF2813333.1 hypothetical protein BDZ99DRAFT_460588 [Mytilinidion resinicola]